MSKKNLPIIIPNRLPDTKKNDAHYSLCHYVNIEVALDRMSYRHCEFDNVVFVYNGGPMEFIDNTVRGFTIRSDNDEINNAFQLLAQFGVIPGNKGAH